MFLLIVYLAENCTGVPVLSLREHVASRIDGGPCLIVTHPLAVWGPLTLLSGASDLIEQLKPELRIMSPDDPNLATELVEVSVTVPVQTMVTEEPSRLSVHVTVAVLPKVIVPVTDLPSAAMVPERPAVGHLTLMAPEVSTESVEVAVTATPAGVDVA